MDDYSHAAEQMKEAIIEEYLKKNPGVKRHEVLTKLVNGRYVVGSIHDAFKEMQSRQKGKLAELGNNEILKELAEGGDERYSKCLTSIESSHKYIDWLFISKFTGFSEKDKVENTDYLEKQSVICAEKALELNDIKKQLVEVMRNTAKPSKSLMNTMVLEYLQSIFGQLKAQRNIYKKEVDLGDWFTNSSKGFFATQFEGITKKPSPAVTRAIARAIALLKDQKIVVPEIQNQQDVKSFERSLNQLGEKLEQRRKKMEELNKLMQFLENAIEKLKDIVAETPQEKPAASSTNRMAYTSKQESKAKRRR